MFYVYMYVRPDGTPWYIGKGSKYRRRHYNHHLPKEFQRPADEFIITVKENMTEAAAFALEIELIAKYKRECDGGILVNKCLGGAGTKGFKHSPDRPSPMKGKQHSAESKVRMSEAAKKRGATHSSTYVLTDKDGNHTVVTNLTAYCREHGLNRKALTNVLCGRSKSSQGYTIQRA